jgi:hypothetical protein
MSYKYTKKNSRKIKIFFNELHFLNKAYNKSRIILFIGVLGNNEQKSKFKY